MNTETEILAVVENLYATALEDDPWTRSLDALSNLFGAAGVSFEIIENASKKPSFMELSSELRAVVPSHEYLDYYGARSPRVEFCFDKPAGFISYDHMILSDAEMDRDEFYADCIRPVGLRYFIAAHVYCSESHQAVLAAQRTPAQGHVGEAEIELMERLVPHLQQATDLKFRLAAERIENRFGLESLEALDEGCLIVDRTRTVLHINQRAGEMVSAGDGIGMIRNRLVFADKNAARHYRRALLSLTENELNAGTAPTRDFSAGRPSGERSYLVSVRRLPVEIEFAPSLWSAAALVFLRDPAHFRRLNTGLLRQTYGLSETEAELAAALDSGSSVHDVARQREVSITTVRSQLYSLMAKLDVRRQTDLARLLAQYRQPFT